MPSLPNDPNLEHFRREARALQRGVRAGDAHSRELLSKHHPAPPADLGALPLSAAQLAVARGYGFASWPKLRHYLDEAAGLTRNPTVDPDHAEESIGNAGDLAHQFCRLACLVYSEVDDPARWARARALLVDHPELVSSSIAAAAAAADADAILAHLAVDPGAVNRLTGPHRWAPLMYLTYSRALPAAADRSLGRDSLRAARVLIEAGADVNDGLPVARTADPVHRADRCLRRGRAGLR